MSKIITLAFLGMISSSVCTVAQITVTPGTTLSVTGGTTLMMAHDVNISNGGTLVTTGVVLMDGGNFSNNGSAVFNGTSALVYNGTAPQQLNTAAPLSVATLVLNNPSGLTPDNSITINNQLVLNNGILYADTSTPVHFANTASYPAETNQSRIVGRAILDPLAVGTNALNFLGCNMVAGTDLGTVSIERNSGPQSLVFIGGDVSIAQNWVITSSTNAAGPSRNVTFSWLSAVDNNRGMTAIFPYGSDSTGNGYTALNTTARDVSSTDPRVYQLPNLNSYNRLFTFSDHNPVGIKTVSAVAAKVSAFPNPFGSVLSLGITKDDDDPVQVRVMDMTGQTVLSNTYKAGRSTVIALPEVGNLAVGSYLVQVFNDHFGKSLKIVKAN
ncbi:MAG: T9SS type A sorting domain-containing protein [Flavipsychrobacter sp.]|nr:T9SS type A sorting domain-containing protein [Flavipsychrobacter sp.]